MGQGLLLKHKNPSVVKATTADTNLRCPHDLTRMEIESIGGVIVDRCNACGRLWLDDEDMQKLLADKLTVHAADLGPFVRESGRAPISGEMCPRDGKNLLEFMHPDKPEMVLEFCPGCRGLLLDAGERRQMSGDEPGSWLAKVRKIVRW